VTEISQFPKAGPLKTVIYRERDARTVLERHRPAPGEPLALEIIPRRYSETIGEAIHGMALAAKAIWPDWYQGLSATPPADDDFDWADALSRLRLAPGLMGGVDKRWLNEAMAAISKRDLPPFFPKLLYETQANQLSLALLGVFNAFHVLVQGDLGPEPNAIALVKGCEWLAKETYSGVTLFLPDRLADQKVFAPLLYKPEHDPGEHPRARPETGPGLGELPPARPQTKPRAGSRITAGSVAKGLGLGQSLDNYGLPSPGVSPGAPARGRRAKGAGDGLPGALVIGEPHPASHIEKRLAEALNSDGRLKGFFLSNQRVEAKERSYVVDFYWPDGGLVVEADGYAFHKGFRAFQNDRLRDYYLTVSGKTVLRLTGLDITLDIDGSLDKIYEMLKFVAKKQGLDIERP
jgi:very-short-patch-repair endonuclease